MPSGVGTARARAQDLKAGPDPSRSPSPLVSLNASASLWNWQRVKRALSSPRRSRASERRRPYGSEPIRSENSSEKILKMGACVPSFLS